MTVLRYQRPQITWRHVVEELRPQIEKALDYGGRTHDFGDIVRKIEGGEFKLFWTDRAVLLLEIIQYPRFRCSLLYLAAGDMNDLCQLEPRALEWARLNGCTQAWATGRPGWERISRLWKYGWKRRPQAWFTKAL